MRTKYSIEIVVVAVAMLSAPIQARATKAVDTTTSTTVFFDNYENQTADSVLTTAKITPGPGSYATSPAAVLARSGASPGAHQGINYIDIDRNGGANTGSQTRLQMDLSNSIPVGNTMQTSFAYNLVSGYYEFQLFGGSNFIWGFYANPDEAGGKWRFFDPVSGNPISDSAALSVGDLNTWHELSFSYVAGSTSINFTVDGTTETINDITTTTLANRSITRMRHTGDGSSGSHFYIDAVPSLNTYDYNSDGTVDAADYVLWRKDPASHLGDPVGYDQWRANFGATSGSGSALPLGASQGTVPEPVSCASIALAWFALGMSPAVRRRQRS